MMMMMMMEMVTFLFEVVKFKEVLRI